MLRILIEQCPDRTVVGGGYCGLGEENSCFLLLRRRCARGAEIGNMKTGGRLTLGFSTS